MNLANTVFGTLVEHGCSGPLPPVRRGRPEGKDARGATILVADGDDEAREAIREVLTEENGWSVIEAQNGADAIALVLDKRPDAAVLDHRMAGMTGKEVVEALRKAGVRSPIVLLALAKDAEILAGVEGMAHLLFKPFGFDQLTAVLARALGSS